MTSKFVDILDGGIFGKFFEENKLKKPTDVQMEAIPKFLEGKNISVLAKTGSGKTFAYLLPMFQMLKHAETVEEAPAGSPKALILLPIKELAMQVHEESKKITHHAKLRVRVALGGQKGKRVTSLKSTQIDVLIGGPGRIKSMLEKGEINLERTEFIVVDEADQLLDMGFHKDLKAIRSHFKKQYQVCLFSATMGSEFDKLKSEIFSGYEFEDIAVQGAHALPKTIETYNIALEYTEKPIMLKQFLKNEAKGSGVVFVNQIENVKDVYAQITELMPDRRTFVLHRELTAEERRKTFTKFRELGGILVASDMAARGIDIEGLAWVLNYDLPFEAVFYIHRSGRVGRGGNQGRVYNFVTHKDKNLITKINEAIQSQSSLKIDPIHVKESKGGQKKSTKKVVARRGKISPKKPARTRK